MDVEISTDWGKLRACWLWYQFSSTTGEKKKKKSFQLLIDFSWKFTNFSQFQMWSLISPWLSYPSPRWSPALFQLGVLVWLLLHGAQGKIPGAECQELPPKKTNKPSGEPTSSKGKKRGRKSWRKLGMGMCLCAGENSELSVAERRVIQLKIGFLGIHLALLLCRSWEKWFGFLQLSIKSGWNEPWKFMVVYELVLVLQGTKMTFKNPTFYSSLLLIAAELDWHVPNGLPRAETLFFPRYININVSINWALVDVPGTVFKTYISRYIRDMNTRFVTAGV